MTDSAVVTGWENSNAGIDSNKAAGGAVAQGWGFDDGRNKQPLWPTGDSNEQALSWDDGDDRPARDRLQAWISEQSSYAMSEFPPASTARDAPDDAWEGLDYIEQLTKPFSSLGLNDVRTVSHQTIAQATSYDLRTPLVELIRLFRGAPSKDLVVKETAKAFIESVTKTECDIAAAAALCATLADSLPSDVTVEFTTGDSTQTLPAPLAFRKLVAGECQTAFYPLARTHDSELGRERLSRLVHFIALLFEVNLITSYIVFLMIHECLLRDQVEAACVGLRLIGRSLDLPKTKPVLDKIFTTLRTLAKDASSPHRDLIWEILSLRDRGWEELPDPERRPDPKPRMPKFMKKHNRRSPQEYTVI